MNKKSCRALVAALLCAAAPVLADDLEKGKEINGTCAACHGEFGQGGKKGEYPRIGGQFAEYLEAQLKAFRASGADPKDVSGRANDPNKMMRMVAVKMTDAEIKTSILTTMKHKSEVRASYGAPVAPMTVEGLLATLPVGMQARRVSRILDAMTADKALTRTSIDGSYIGSNGGRRRDVVLPCKIAAWFLA
jgi:cytochrome c553